MGVGARIGGEAVKQRNECRLFFGCGCSSNDVTRQTAQHGGFIKRTGKRGNNLADDSHEGVAVEVAERRETVTMAAKVSSFRQRHFRTMAGLPQLTGRFVAVAGGLVQRASGQAELAIRLYDDRPSEGLEPRALYEGPPRDLSRFARWISSTVLLA